MSRPTGVRKAASGSNDTAAVGAETAADRSPRRSQASRQTTGRPTVRDVARVAGVSFRRSRASSTARRACTRDRRAGARGNEAARVPAQRDGVQPETRDAQPGHRLRPRHRGCRRPVLRHGRPGGRARHPGARDAGDHRELVDEDKSRERRVSTLLVSRRVSGLVVVPIGSDHRYLAREMRHGMAVVFVELATRARAGPTACSWTTPGGQRAGVAHLHRLRAPAHRVLLTDDLGVYTMSERFDGYRQAPSRMRDSRSTPPSPVMTATTSTTPARRRSLLLGGRSSDRGSARQQPDEPRRRESAITTRGIVLGSSASTTSSWPPRSSRRSRSCEPTTRPWAGSARSCCSAAWTAGTAIHSASCCRPRSCHGARVSSLRTVTIVGQSVRLAGRASDPWDDASPWMTT